MKPFCEVIVSRMLPAIRAILTQDLLDAGLTQTEVAQRLGVTQPAISQYRRELRGRKVRFMEQDKEVRAYIRRLAADVAKGKLNAIELQHRLCELCERVRRKGLMCELHKAVYPALELCKTCP